MLYGGLNWQYAWKTADFTRWHIVTSRLAELHVSIWQQQAVQLFKSPTMSEAQTQKPWSFLHFFSCDVTGEFLPEKLKQEPALKAHRNENLVFRIDLMNSLL